MPTHYRINANQRPIIELGSEYDLFYEAAIESIISAADANQSHTLLTVRPTEGSFIDPLSSCLRELGYAVRLLDDQATLLISWGIVPDDL